MSEEAVRPQSESAQEAGGGPSPVVSSPAPEAAAGPVAPGAETPATPPKVRRKRLAWAGSLQSLAVTIAIAIFVITFIVQAFQIPSESMEDTLLIGDYLLVDKAHFSPAGLWSHILPYDQVKRGDIIVFRYPVNPTQHFVKRVIGLPGDRIRLVNRQVWINEKPLTESYTVFHSEISEPYRDNFPRGDYPASVTAEWWKQLHQLVQGGELRVPPGKYFVMGDNRDESLDSRYWGFVPRENIVGRPLIIYFSVASPDVPFPEARASSDRLSGFAHVLSDAVHGVRWTRTLKIVN